MRYGILILLCLTLQIIAIPLKTDSCGYSACTPVDPKALNVHIVAHSHDDVGWLKTVDQYYYGSSSGIQFAGVQYIIDSVIRALKANPERKYIQVESAFFYKWWWEQSQTRRDEVIDLIKNGQLEIAGGAWSMNDEAAAHYHSIIDQFTFGLKFLDDIFKDAKECARPKIGWQIDPFGHTREMASIFAQMGYDALFFARLDWRDKGERLSTNTGEMLWKSSANLDKEDSMLFTHILYNHYSPPPGFYFDVLSEDDPLIPDENSSEYNLDVKMADFTDYVNKQMRNYTSNNILITMGNDFTYQDALYSFKNLDILIKGFKESEHFDSDGRRINLLYSTPACYIKAVHDYASANETITFKVKTDDFIPYASDYHTYWSGYYTSRPTQKRFERQGNNFLQVTKQLTAFSGPQFSELDKNLDSLRSAMGIMQHHDAITGTEKEPVAQDYARLVMKAFDKTHTNVNQIIPKLLAKTEENVNLKFSSCLLANVSHCEESQAKKFVVAVYNPLSRPVSHHVRIPVNSREFTITGPDNDKTPIFQITPSIDKFSYLPDDIKPSRFDLVFLATEIPALGLRTYFIEDISTVPNPADIPPVTDPSRFDLGTEDNRVRLNPYTGLMTRVIINKIGVPIRQQLMHYIGAQGNNMVFENRSSGAYIFRPDPENPKAIPFTESVLDNMKVYKGDLVDEVHQTFNEWNKQIIRVYKKAENNYIELDWLVGPIDTKDNKSREVISRFSSSLNSQEFYTDSNGREMLKRLNNHRETWTYSNEEPIAGNYYPVTSSISLVDTGRKVEMTVLNDRAQGGASLESGQIELMVHRRLLKDDAFGVGEPLVEDEFGKGLVVGGQHFLTVGPSEEGTGYGYSRKNLRDIAQRKILAPWLLVADASHLTLEKLEDNLNFEFSGMRKELDATKQVQLLTLEPWRDNKILLRFEHILEKSEGGKDVTIDLEGLFTLFDVTALEETTLGANQKITEKDRLWWKPGGCLSKTEEQENPENCKLSDVPEPTQKYAKEKVELNDIVLSPMQIRTFVAEVKFRS